jgi:hypothetical protein
MTLGVPAGPPGTGKSLSVEILADVLWREAGLVSRCYVQFAGYNFHKESK